MAEVTRRVKEARLGRLQPYGEYRNSGVEWLGKLPSHWEVKPVKAALIRNDSGVWGEDFDDDGTIVLRSTEQTMQGTWRIGDPARRRLTAREATYARLLEGDLLVTKSSGSAHHIGKTSIVDESIAALDCCYSNFMQRLRVSAEHIPQFFWYFMNCPVAREQLVFLSSTTTGLGNLNGSILGAIRIPMAPLGDQRAIADFLDRETAKIDSLVARKERLIELLQEKRTALITRAVTRGLDPNVPMKDSGVEWLGEIPAHWEVCRLRRVVSKFVDYRGKTPEKSVSGVPLITARNIKNQSIDFSLSEEFIPEELYPKWMVRGRPERGDVVITMEAPLGETAQIVDTGIALAQRVILLKVDATKITNDYLKYHFAADSGRLELRTRATGSTALGIKASHLKSSLIAVPSLCEQDEISRKVRSESEEVDVLIAKVREAIGRLREFRTALISAAVTGKIDVREAMPR